MTERDPFNSPSEEVARLVSELGAVKKLVHEVSQQLGRIETRLKRAFPAAFPSVSAKAKASGAQARQAPTISPEEALGTYEELVRRARTGGREEVQAKLSSMTLSDLDLMRRELGVPLGSKKPSKKLLASMIQSRINESLMIGQHTDRDRVLSEGSEVASQEKPTRTESASTE